MANQYSATLTTETPLIEVGDVVVAMLANKYADIALWQAITILYPDITNGVGNVSTSGASTTVTCATSGAFASVYPGATITSGEKTVTVVSVNGDNATVTPRVTLSAGSWTYKNLSSVIPYDDTDSTATCNGVALQSHSRDDDACPIQIKRMGVYPMNELSTAVKTKAQVTTAVHNQMQGFGLIGVSRAFKEF